MTRPIKNHASFWPVQRFFDAFALIDRQIVLVRRTGEVIRYRLLNREGCFAAW
ncbi:MAG: hypothetical protein R6X19_10690 [Kiritimatiellia bacterium]